MDSENHFPPNILGPFSCKAASCFYWHSHSVSCVVVLHIHSIWKLSSLFVSHIQGCFSPTLYKGKVGEVQGPSSRAHPLVCPAVHTGPYIFLQGKMRNQGTTCLLMLTLSFYMSWMKPISTLILWNIMILTVSSLSTVLEVYKVLTEI